MTIIIPSMLESLMRRFDGRPHWAKRFEACSNDFQQVHIASSLAVSLYYEAPIYNVLFPLQTYPKWSDFLKLREELDPQRRFFNAFLQRVFRDDCSSIHSSEPDSGHSHITGK